MATRTTARGHRAIVVVIALAIAALVALTLWLSLRASTSPTHTVAAGQAALIGSSATCAPDQPDPGTVDQRERHYGGHLAPPM